MSDYFDGTWGTDVADHVLALVGSRASAVVSAVAGISSLTRFANSRIHQNVTEDRAFVTLAVALDGGRMARAVTTRADPAGLAALVERALAAAALRPPDPEFAGFAPMSPVPAVDHWDDATSDPTPARRAEVVAAFVDAVRSSAAASGSSGGGKDRAPEAAGYCATKATTLVLASSTGQRAIGRVTAAEVDGIARAATDGPPADGLGHATSSRLADLDGAACGRVAGAKAVAGLTAVSVPPGAWEVVLEPKAVAEALLFPAYLGFNGKQHAEGTSFVHLGEAQWDAGIDLWDDATDARALGMPVDHEGTPTARLDLVRAGVSVGLAHDRRTAALAGAEPTGHSVGAEAMGAIPTDLFLGPAAGASPPPSSPSGDVLAGVERGLLVSDLWYNRILDPKSQVVTGLTRNGLFLVEGGQVVGAVRNLRYTQSIAGAFGPGRVLALGDDARLVGQDGVRVFTPSVRLARWAFTGDATG